MQFAVSSYNNYSVQSLTGISIITVVIQKFTWGRMHGVNL